jgi:hypothetical protein
MKDPEPVFASSKKNAGLRASVFKYQGPGDHCTSTFWV